MNHSQIFINKGDTYLSFDHLYEVFIKPLNEFWKPVNRMLENVATTTFDNNATTDQLKLVGCFLFSIILGFIFIRIKTPILRHVFSTVVGLILSFFVYEGYVIFVHLYTVIVYLLCAIFGKNSQKVVFVFSFMFLSAHHIYRQITDYGSWRMDVTVILMINLCKYVSFAFCYSDGFRDESKLSKDQREHVIKKLPNFLKFFSYINFYGSAVAGPTFDYNDYDDFMNLIHNYKHIPNPLLDTLKNLGIGIIYLLITAIILPQFPVSYAITDEFGQLKFYKKIIYINIAIILIRFRYYTAWKLIQASLSASGISYNDSTQHFDKIVTVDERLELTHEVKQVVDKWNKTIQVFLKRYVYYRLYSEEEIRKSRTKAAYSQYATLIVSAFWHGFYPGYYFAFIQWSILISVSKCFYKAACNDKTKAIFDMMSKFGYLYRFARWLAVTSIFNSFAVNFVLLSSKNAWLLSKNMYFIPLIIVVAFFSFFLITNWGQKATKKTVVDETKKTEVDENRETSKPKGD